MARRVRITSAAAPAPEAQVPRAGSARACALFRGELARHRVITADGLDYVVTSAVERGQGYVTAAYPVARGYLVMMRQPLCLLNSVDDAAARAQHALLVRVLTQGGTGVVRARRRSAAWRRAERTVDAPTGAVAIEPGDLMDTLVASGAGNEQASAS
jgi:hypothetical protein